MSSLLPRKSRPRSSCRSIVQAEGQLEAVFEAIEKQWGKLDICLHSIAFAPKADLQGRVVDCSKEGFLLAMDVSCWSFIRMAKLAEPLMKDGGTLSTMTYYGSQMVVEHYNMMGPVKAALEAVTSLSRGRTWAERHQGARDFARAAQDPRGVRHHRFRRTDRQGSGEGARPGGLVSIEDVGVAVAFLSMNGAKLITGETLYIDGGYHIID